ncbi:hypothetical protein Hamer_G005562 [Homarus americanus]|uniref:Uncharacterized protein n=1 Tax=Homarus americanus TaxID=6706 RepID=A0A8J5JZE4_HOMAM|nr:hypothetical protein Hamer_G005562 [Homarus americanus]
MMTDIIGRDVVDHLPILVSGGNAIQLLGIPKLHSGTGKSMAGIVNKAIEEWSVKNNVVAKCFDTTATNTGGMNGASTLFEQKMEKELLHLACRHHIIEIVLEAAFMAVVGISTGPDILMFKRFQQKWGLIDKSIPSTVMDTRPDPWDVVDHLPILVSGGNAIQLLGIPKLHSGTGKSMAGIVNKAIEEWSVKNNVVAKCFDTTATNTGGMNGASTLFEQKMEKELLHLACRHHIIEIVLEAAFMAVISAVALKKFQGHLWYLRERLVTLALFYDSGSITLEDKRAMAQRMLRTTDEMDPMKRAVDWKADYAFQRANEVVMHLKVVNDLAERGVALMTEYTKLITADEEQKQYLLQVVADHRKQFPTPKKSALV